MLTVNTQRFGAIEVEEDQLISLPEGLPGLPDFTHAVLVGPEESRPVMWLQDTRHPEIALPVVETFLVCSDYSLDVPDGDIARLQITTEGDLWVLSILVIPEDMTRMTANLTAPLLINHQKRLGKQVVVDDRRYNMRTPAYEPICRWMLSRQAQTEGGEADAGTHPQGG